MTRRIKIESRVTYTVIDNDSDVVILKTDDILEANRVAQEDA